jgi:hypothetical protein
MDDCGDNLDRFPLAYLNTRVLLIVPIVLKPPVDIVIYAICRPIYLLVHIVIIMPE